MANEPKVMTAPLALIRVDGLTIGKMKDIRCTESIRRGNVKGIGTIVPSELPALDWTGTLSASFMTINLSLSMIPGLINRASNTVEQWMNNVLLQEEGVDIVILRKVKSDPLAPEFVPGDPSKGTPRKLENIKGGILYPGGLQEFATIRGVFITREGFNIAEAQISNRDVEMEYLTPILYTT